MRTENNNGEAGPQPSDCLDLGFRVEVNKTLVGLDLHDKAVIKIEVSDETDSDFQSEVMQQEDLQGDMELATTFLSRKSPTQLDDSFQGDVEETTSSLSSKSVTKDEDVLPGNVEEVKASVCSKSLTQNNSSDEVREKEARPCHVKNLSVSGVEQSVKLNVFPSQSNQSSSVEDSSILYGGVTAGADNMGPMSRYFAPFNGGPMPWIYQNAYGSAYALFPHSLPAYGPPAMFGYPVERILGHPAFSAFQPGHGQRHPGMNVNNMPPPQYSLSGNLQAQGRNNRNNMMGYCDNNRSNDIEVRDGVMRNERVVSTGSQDLPDAAAVGVNSEIKDECICEKLEQGEVCKVHRGGLHHISGHRTVSLAGPHAGESPGEITPVGGSGNNHDLPGNDNDDTCMHNEHSHTGNHGLFGGRDITQTGHHAVHSSSPASSATNSLPSTSSKLNSHQTDFPVSGYTSGFHGGVGGQQGFVSFLKSPKKRKASGPRRKKGEPKRRHFCEICGREFTKVSDMKRHVKSKHTMERPYKCDICGAGFVEKFRVAYHRRIHTGEKPYMCEICGKRFTHYAQVRCHHRTHTGEKPFKCDICESRFAWARNLRLHLLTHTGEKPYKCEICGVSYREKGYVKKHMQIHLEEKQLKCHLCPATFRRKASLQQHVRGHSGEKPYKCDICGVAYSKSESLTNHRRSVHPEQKNFKCDVCSMEFRMLAQLRRHKDQEHAGDRIV